MPIVKHGGGSIVAWGCLSGNYSGDIVKIDKILTKEVHLAIFLNHVIPLGCRIIGGPFLFQEENDPTNPSKLRRNHLSELENNKTIERMIILLNFYFMNLIEIKKNQKNQFSRAKKRQKVKS